MTSKLLKALKDKPPRKRAEPTGTMRERIAVALRVSAPNAFKWTPSEAYDVFLFENAERRKWYEEWADRFLANCDVLDLEMTDTQSSV